MGASRDFLTFFRLTLKGQTPQPMFTQNGSNDVDLRKDDTFAVKIATFHTPWSPGPLKGQNFAIFGLTKFSLDSAINIRGHGENTPYSSSELNESDIVNRQSGGKKLKYVLKFYIGGTCHVISRMRNDDLALCLHEHTTFGGDISASVRDRNLDPKDHQ